jgi:tetratricopeptide (TPR) repeat protein
MLRASSNFTSLPLRMPLRMPLVSRTPRMLLVPLVLVLSVGAPVHAQSGGDLQAQILYAYHAEDRNELVNVIQTLKTQEQAGAVDGALRYHLAHADYRLALLEREAPAHAAQAALEECIDELKPVIEQDASSVEALALQSACYSNLAKYRKFEAVLFRSRAADRLRAALALGPKNPRVLYLAAIDALARAKPGSPEAVEAFERLELAAQLFEQSSSTGIDAPGWGHAEAYLELGRRLQLKGDVLGARNWIEKALIVSPDYKAARRQLATLAHP